MSARSPRNGLAITEDAGPKQKHMCPPLSWNIMAFKEMDLSLWKGEGGDTALAHSLQGGCLVSFIMLAGTCSMDYIQIICPRFILQTLYCSASDLCNEFINRWVTRKKSLSILTVLVLIVE